jgi:hypothetical protein
MVTAEDLMAGPRGRRLLCAFAVASEREVLGEGAELPLGAAVLDASFRLAKEHGHAVTRFGWGATWDGPLSTSADVASRLAEVSLVPADPEALIEALAAAVDSAMYWQEPDGEDLLCATPAVRDALWRVGEHLAGFPAVQAWTAPVDPADQWQVVWDDGELPPRPDLSAWREEVLAQERAAERDRPADPRANWTGEWWSRPPYGPASTGSFGDAGPYGLWLVEDALGWADAAAYRLEVEPSSRVLEIDGTTAWAALCAEFPLEVTASKRHDWYRTTGRAGRWVIPDWSLVGERYDGVHLTIAGYLAAATTCVDVGEVASVIAGWGPDTTWWLNGTTRPASAPHRWQATHVEGQPLWTPVR